MFSEHHETKLDINKRKILGKSPNIWKLNNTFLNNPWVKRNFKGSWKKKTYQNLWNTTKQS